MVVLGFGRVVFDDFDWDPIFGGRGAGGGGGGWTESLVFYRIRNLGRFESPKAMLE